MAAPFPKSLKWLAVSVLLFGFGLFLATRKRPAIAGVTVETAARAVSSKETLMTTPGWNWEEMIGLIDRGAPANDILERLTELKFDWCDQDPRAIAESISLLLRDGRDRETGLPFETGHGGSLRSWPTLRVFLLDVLMSTDPDLAVEVAREVLAETKSAEEYAVAMRALVMENPWRASDQELEARLDTLLSREDWQVERRAGFAEALDLVREIATQNAFQRLAVWVDEAGSFKDAGAMALHEFTADHPDVALRQLEEDPTLFEQDSGLRAGLMARAEPADPEQLEAVENYLDSPQVDLEEKRRFLGLFPLRSATTGFRLYGGTPVPFDREQVMASDTAAAQAVQGWLQREEFGGMTRELEALQERLLEWRKAAEETESP